MVRQCLSRTFKQIVKSIFTHVASRFPPHVCFAKLRGEKREGKSKAHPFWKLNSSVLAWPLLRRSITRKSLSEAGYPLDLKAQRRDSPSSPSSSERFNRRGGGNHVSFLPSDFSSGSEPRFSVAVYATEQMATPTYRGSFNLGVFKSRLVPSRNPTWRFRVTEFTRRRLNSSRSREICGILLPFLVEMIKWRGSSVLKVILRFTLFLRQLDSLIIIDNIFIICRRCISEYDWKVTFDLDDVFECRKYSRGKFDFYTRCVC